MKKNNLSICPNFPDFRMANLTALILTFAFIFFNTMPARAGSDVWNCRNALSGNNSCVVPITLCTGTDAGCHVGDVPGPGGAGLQPATGSYNPADSDAAFSSCYFFGWQGPGSNGFFQCAQYNSFPPNAAACNTNIINGCTQGTLVDTLDSGTDYQWNCRSTDGSATASCSKSKTQSSWSSLGCGVTTTNYNNTCATATAPVAQNCPAGEHVEIRDIFDCPVTAGNNLSHRETRCIADSAGCGTIASPVCGYANGQTYASAPHSADALCSNGAPSVVAGPALGPWSWTCATGSSTNCLATTCANVCSVPAVDGSCSATPHVCSYGAPNAIADTATDYIWKCQGTNRGANTACSMPKPIPGVCSTTTEHICTSPMAANNISDTFTDYVWDCPGSYGGATASCTKPKPSIAACPTGWGPVPVNSTADFPDAAGAQTWAYDHGYCDSETTRLPGTMLNDRCAVAVGLQAFTRTCRVDGECGTTENTCASPAAATNPTDDGTNYIWDCEGRGPGHTDSSGQAHCTKPMPPSCGTGANITANSRPECESQGYTVLAYQDAQEFGDPCLGGPTTGACQVASVSAGTPPLARCKFFVKPACAGVAVNGVCSTTTEHTCISGNASDFADTPSDYVWQCMGQNGGTDATNCTKPKPVVVNGSCDNSVQNGCTAGSLNDIGDSGSDYLWECIGSGPGHTDATNCSKAKPVVVNGSCDNSVQNGCTAGSLNDIGDSGSDYLWECIGSGPGHTDATNCSKPKPVVVNGSCDNSVQNGCTAGSLNDIGDSGSDYLWECLGSGPGHTDATNCSKPIPPAPIAGACGSAKDTCTSPAAATNPGNNGTDYTWDCPGSNSGVPALGCTAPIPAARVDGVCDESTVNGCVPGTGSAINTSSSGGYDYWECEGVNGGNPSAQCKKAIPPAPIAGACGSAKDTCTSPMAATNPGNNGTDYTWDCPGSNSGAPALGCTAPIPPAPIAGACGTAKDTCTSPMAATNPGNNGTDYTWDCPGSNSGAPALGCTAPIPTCERSSGSYDARSTTAIIDDCFFNAGFSYSDPGNASATFVRKLNNRNIVCVKDLVATTFCPVDLIAHYNDPECTQSYPSCP